MRPFRQPRFSLDPLQWLLLMDAGLWQRFQHRQAWTGRSLDKENPMAEQRGAMNSGPPAEGAPAAARLYTEVLHERRTLQRMRVISSLTLLAILIVYLLFIGRRVSQFDQMKFGSALQQKLAQLGPEIGEMVSNAVEENREEMKAKVRRVAQARMPRLQLTIAKNYEALRQNLLDRLQERLLKELEQQLAVRGEQVLEAFPELGNREERGALLMRLESLARSTAERVLAKDIADCRRSLESIEITLHRQDVRRRIAMLKADPKIRERTVGYVLAVIARPLCEGAPARGMGSAPVPAVDER